MLLASSEISRFVIAVPFGSGLLGIPSLVPLVSKKQLYQSTVRIDFPHKGNDDN
jgi:hypothetical protein